MRRSQNIIPYLDRRPRNAIPSPFSRKARTCVAPQRHERHSGAKHILIRRRAGQEGITPSGMVRGRCTTLVVPRFPSVVLPGPSPSPCARVRKTRGWPLVPLYAVRDLRPGTWALAVEETGHDATVALITLVATHMLNVHPVMPPPHSGGRTETEKERERERERGYKPTYSRVHYKVSLRSRIKFRYNIYIVLFPLSVRFNVYSRKEIANSPGIVKCMSS